MKLTDLVELDSVEIIFSNPSKGILTVSGKIDEIKFQRTFFASPEFFEKMITDYFKYFLLARLMDLLVQKTQAISNKGD